MNLGENIDNVVREGVKRSQTENMETATGSSCVQKKTTPKKGKAKPVNV